MWIVDILIDILTQLFRAGVDAAQERADAAPPVSPPPPGMTPSPRLPQQSGGGIPGLPTTRQPTYQSTSQDPDYERTPWRRLLSIMILLVISALIVFWLLSVLR